MSFIIKTITDPDEKTSITQKIMHQLHQWFSPPSDIENKAVTHRQLPFFAAQIGDDVVGFVALTIHNDHTAEIFSLGVLPEYHRMGAGSLLLEAAEGYSIMEGLQFLTVKTLDSATDYPPYDSTRAFYLKTGFVPLQVFPNHWDAENPCLFMAKYLGNTAPLRVFFPPTGPDSMEFVVIAARFDGKWLFVRHKERETYEIPGGHVEAGEPLLDAARRELYEESGAADFTLTPVCCYGVMRGGAKTYGQFYLAHITRFDDMPDFEMKERLLLADMPHAMTYPQIQPLLFEKAKAALENPRL